MQKTIDTYFAHEKILNFRKQSARMKNAINSFKTKQSTTEASSSSSKSINTKHDNNDSDEDNEQLNLSEDSSDNEKDNNKKKQKPSEKFNLKQIKNVKKPTKTKRKKISQRK